MIVNGRQQQYIEIADRAFQYGDGCFTTMAFRNSHLEFFDEHIQRLKLACSRLYIDFDQWSELEVCVVDSLKSAGDCVVKVIITRGQGGRGYSPVGATHPNFVISHHSIPSHYTLWQSEGIRLSISPITLACQPLLAGIKHLNRLEQVLVKHSLAQTRYDDVIVCDTHNQIIETSVGNLFWYKNDSWYTPSLMESGVDGVMRNQILLVMEENGLSCEVVKQDVSDLLTAQELFVCNSLMVMVPVVNLFNPINQQNTDYVVDQSKRLQHYVQQKINLKAINV
jgi:4-amino-4-deoxychorismate lyase